MVIVYFVLFLINYMEHNNIINKYVKYVCNILNIKNNSIKILYQRILMSILIEKKGMEFGVMIYKYKLYLRYIQDLLKFMYFKINQFEHFIKIIKIIYNLLDQLMLEHVIMILLKIKIKLIKG